MLPYPTLFRNQSYNDGLLKPLKVPELVEGKYSD